MTAAAPLLSGAAPAFRIARTAPRIEAIQGIRGWLAWTVVVSHVVQIAGLDRTDPLWWITQFLAHEAVNLFIIISGFVICGLLIAKRETWRVFIIRRAFRIYPTYLVLLPIAAGTLFLANRAIAHMGWAGNPEFLYDDTIHRTIASVQSAPLAHVLLNLLLLQGLFPNAVLDQSATSFIGPAWSLSLEWQFYLIAPFLVAALRDPRRSIYAAAALMGSALLYKIGLFGHFSLPSIFPAAAPLFLIGMATRALFHELMRMPIRPAAMALACVAAALLFPSVFAIALWGAVMALLSADLRTAAPADLALLKLRHIAFHSPIALGQGARSYPIYLAHWPVLQLVAFLILPIYNFTQWQAFAVLGVATIAGTLLVAQLLHVGVEKPMIRLGSRVASRLAPQPRDPVLQPPQLEPLP